MSALDELLDYLVALAGSAGPAAFARGTVATVAAGTPPTVTVTWKDAPVPARCPKRWTTSDIAVGDDVLMAQLGSGPASQLLILNAY